MKQLRYYFEEASGYVRKWFGGDKVLWITVLILSMFSITGVYSASSYMASDLNVSKLEIFGKQFAFVLGGWGILLIACFIHPKYYRKYSYVLFAAGIALMLALFIPGLRAEQNGAIRGIKFFGFTIQVFEIAKVAIIIYLARTLEISSIDSWKDYLLKLLVPIGLTCALVLRGSFSAALFIAMICFIILWVNRVKWKFLAATIAAGIGIVLGGYGIYSATKHWDNPIFVRFGTAESRIEKFIESAKGEEIDRTSMSKSEYEAYLDENRQSENAKISIHEGGLLGKGPGKSTQRYALSMAFSDFIYAFLIEEYGSITGVFIMFLYIWLFARCAQLAVKCNSTFASTMVFGLGLLITCQALMHILVNVRLAPITGHTLPLVSHGGSAFLVFSGAMGMILSVSRAIRPEAAADTEHTTTETETDNESDN